MRDLKERHRPPRITAFNKSLPKEARFVPSKMDPEVWVKYKGDKQILASMSNVWKGITHLRSCIRLERPILLKILIVGQLECSASG